MRTSETKIKQSSIMLNGNYSLFTNPFYKYRKCAVNKNSKNEETKVINEKLRSRRVFHPNLRSTIFPQFYFYRRNY